MSFSGIAPACPRCGSTDGGLGTSYAYFMCRNCNDGNAVYWTEDHNHPRDWDKAIQASPWARARQALERKRAYGPQPTPDECAKLMTDLEKLVYRLL